LNFIELSQNIINVIFGLEQMYDVIGHFTMISLSQEWMWNELKWK